VPQIKTSFRDGEIALSTWTVFLKVKCLCDTFTVYLTHLWSNAPGTALNRQEQYHSEDWGQYDIIIIIILKDSNTYWSKVTAKTFIMLQKIFNLNKLSLTFYSSKYIHVSSKTLSSTLLSTIIIRRNVSWAPKSAY